MHVPGYTVDGERHRGRKSLICAARRDSDDACVIIKSSVAEFPSGSETASLRREHEILRSLRIGGIPQTYGLETVRDRLALVLEARSGTPLKERIAREPVTLIETLDIATALVATIAELHQQHIIHKNITPSNILVDRERDAITLLDFGISSRVNSEQQHPQEPHLLEGALAYMSPEQTGRMNRDVDYRSDFYSLGATFYEMLTGHLPFDTTDPLELIHCHIAQIPVPPGERVPTLPRVVSDLVMKLLAKSPEDRYQSAHGLLTDLRQFQQEWRATGQITPGRLAIRDVADRFVIPQRLYGRDREMATLREAFDRAGGGTELVLVGGYSGIGKTSLIHEIYKKLPRKRARFISGKFDQLARDIPYDALLQAFRALVRQLLTEDDSQIRAWADLLGTALGANAQVMLDVMPELAQITGPQPPVPPLGAAETQQRFNLLFQKFVGVFARPAHPLVIFLDDLQWADTATLSLLPPLLSNPELTGLLLIGAFRENEVSPTHPLRLTIGDLTTRAVPVSELSLPPLAEEDLRQFIADVLRTTPECAAPCAELVLRKTGGNPFFVTQFLRTLHQEGLIAFDHRLGEWQADVEAIRQARITDNVVELMSSRILRLGHEAQRVLRQAACVGNRFDLRTLATVSELSPAEAAAQLWEAVSQELVVPLDKSYGFVPDLTAGQDPGRIHFSFLHDRVQQAAYALIPDAARPSAHLSVGRLLLAHGNGEPGADSLFDVVNHLNIGRGLITDSGERVRLAELNLAAGRKSKASAAYPSARSYFTIGSELLPPTAWATHYPLAFALQLERAEAEYLSGSFRESEESFRSAIERAGTTLEKADAYALLIVQYENMERFADAISASTEALALLDIELPTAAAATRAAFQAELEAIQGRLAGRPLAQLAALPRLEDPRVHRAMKLLAATWASSYILADDPLTSLIGARMVSLSLAFGNCAESAFGYVVHATTLGSRLGDFKTGHEFGELALEVNRQLDDVRLRAKVHHMFSAFVNLWRRPFSTCLPHAREAYRWGVESGDIPFASYGIFHQSWYALLLERDLEAFHGSVAPSVEFLRRVKMDVWADLQQLILHWGRALQGRTEAPTSLSSPDFNESAFCEAYLGIGIFKSFYSTTRLALLTTFEAYDEARAWAEEWETAAMGFVGSVWPQMFLFHHLIVLTAVLPKLDGDDAPIVRAKADALLARLKRWADNSPENFEHQYLLGCAELARIDGRIADAITSYEAAIDAAGQQPSPRHRALANELYARFWLGRGQRTIAATFIAEARYGYSMWGATAKVDDLDRRYADLLRATPALAATLHSGATTTDVLGRGLDTITVARAAQAISRELDLDKLLERLLRVALESAGAERGSFLLESDGELQVRVEGSGERIESRFGASAAAASDRVPASVANYVRHSSDNVVLANAPVDDRFGGDLYVVRERPLSLIATPVLNQGRLVGVLYLENRLAADAFTPARVEVLQILCAQAAIAIQNAQLFAEVNRLRDRLQAENTYLVEEVRTQHDFTEIIGVSPALTRVLDLVQQVAPTESTVLITGETGTGKELIARAIHERSNRRDKSLVSINCGAISPTLVESELFGHEKGAFTGAVQRKVGRFELADGGTLFLDEIGDLPLDLQVKLLRVLQEGEFERVGGTRGMRVDVRVIAATHQNLQAAVAEGRFRADLFYRLNVFPIHMPALRDRKDDIPLLVRHLVQKYAARLGRKIENIPTQAVEALTAYPWPGNIRELGNIIERSVIVSRDQTLRLAEWVTGQYRPVPTPPRAASSNGGAGAALLDVERAHIKRTLEGTGWKVSGAGGAAEALGLKPTTLEARMKKLGITRPGR